MNDRCEVTGQYKKGRVPYNKGIKRGNFGRMTETQFKKGCKPPKYRPIGSESYSKRDETWYVKVSDPNEWKSKQRIEWETHNGELPKGHIIIFLDGNRENINIDNLAAITRAQNVRLNKMKMRFKNGELTKASVNLVELLELIRKSE